MPKHITSKASELVATLILEATETKESSYDHEASDNATAKAQAEYDAVELKHPRDLIMFPYVDYKKFYGLTLTQACEQVCTKHNVPEFTQLIDYSLYSAWNDVLDWAKHIKGVK